jgi:hypothetical protein
LRQPLIHEEDILMADPKQQPERKPSDERTTKKPSDSTSAAKADPPPGESIEGEGSPGLSILGGGGHA